MTFKDYCLNNKPYIVSEWDVSKNGPLDERISFSSHKKYWFVCSKCGTRFQTSPHSISVSKFNCCPKCWADSRTIGRKKAAYKKKSIKSVGGLLLIEFNEDKNKTDASEVSANSITKYWWKCSYCGYEWEASPHNRTRGTGCPRCAKITHTSFPEQAIYYYVKKVYPDAINSDRHLGFELDIFIPSRNIAIEYDGEAWHQDRKKDERKNIVCAQHKILLIRIREKSCWFWPQSTYLQCLSSVSGDKNELNESIKRLFFIIKDDLAFPDIDVISDEKEIRSTYINAKKNNSLSSKFPSIASEWDFEKNNPITPDRIDYGSGIKFWWKCPKCGFKYKMTPNYRTSKGAGCPSCAHVIVNSGVTDLATVRPDLMKEWDFEKNSAIQLDPSNMLPNSEKKAWWKCSACGNEWLAMIGNRNRGRGCPVCAKNKRKKKAINM